MRVLVDDQPAGDFSPALAAGIDLVPAATGPVVGQVMSASHALNVAWITIGRNFWSTYFAVIVGPFLGLFMYDYSFSIGRFWVASISAAALASLVGWAYWSLYDGARTNIDKRIAALPPTGTSVRFDARGLTIGTRLASWEAMRIDTVELRAAPLTKRTIERLLIAGPDGPIVLDRLCITAGQALADSAFRRLAPVASAPSAAAPTS